MGKNILMIYGSSTGNTQSMSHYLTDLLKKQGHYVRLEDVVDIDGNEVLKEESDVIFICVSTWGIEPAELQEDFELFWKRVNKGILRDKKFVVIGMGDAYYPHFAVAKDMVEEDIKNNGGEIVDAGIKIQDPWEDYKGELQEIAKRV